MTIYDPPLELAQVTAPLSRTTIEDKLYEIYDTLEVDRSHWVAGYVMDAFTVGASIILAGLSNLTADLAKAPYLSLASTTWLRLKAFYDYDCPYLQANQAVGQVTLTNSGVAAQSGLANEKIVAHSVTGKTYRITQAFTVNPASSITVPILAVESGTASNAAPNTITALVTPMTGVTVNNAASVIGRDDENNQDLITRARESVAQWSPNNARGAYSSVLKAARRSSDGTLIGVTRVRPVPDGYGNVACYVASATGAISDPSDILDLSSAIQQTTEPEGVNAFAISASPTNIAVTANIYTNGAKSAAFVLNAAGQALIALANAQQIGGVRYSGTGYVYRAEILAALKNCDPSVYNVVLSAPSADTVISVNHFPVFTPVNILVVTT